MWSKLSSISRLTAIVRRSTRPEGFLMWLKPGVVGMEGQRDERLEAAGLVLQLAQPHQMIDAMERVFDVAVEHRGVGAQPEFVGRAVDVEPAAGVGLVLADLVADLGMKDLGPAAGQAAQAGVDHALRAPRGSSGRSGA